MPDSDTRPEDASRSRRPVLIASIALPVALLVGVLVAAGIAQREPARDRVTVSSVPTPDGDSRSCTDLGAALTDSVGSYQRADLDDPAPATYAWHKPGTDDVLVLRCGIDQPLEFVVGSSLASVNGVQWFQAGAAAFTLGTLTYVAVDRDVYIALNVPIGEGPTPLQTISDTIADVLPEVQPTPLPLPN